MATEIPVSNLEEPCRLERFLKKRTCIPYSMIQKLFRKKLVLLDGQKANPETMAKNGQIITFKANLEWQTPPGNKATHNPKHYQELVHILRERLLFQDENILVFNKPCDVAVQGGSKVKISVDAVLDEFKLDSKFRPKLVHRLDKEASGVLLVARNIQTAKILAQKFREKNINKTYTALLQGTPNKHHGTIKILLNSSYIPSSSLSSHQHSYNRPEIDRIHLFAQHSAT